ncbi:MAG: aminotransferase class IV [Pirellulaceae bacterium]|nr:aminotransferase class IV [Pirellulaceae bacterium]
MTKRYVYISGEFVVEEDAKISVNDSAVLLGYSVTDSSRTFAHRPFKIERHVDRMYKSLKAARIDPGMSSAEMVRVTCEVTERNLEGLESHQDLWIVHTVSNGQTRLGPDPSVRESGATIIISNPFLDLRGWAGYYSTGCHAVTSTSRAIPAQSLDARIKNRSRMAYTLAEAEVKLVDSNAQGVILDVNGFVAENKGGNIFIVSEGELLTPTTVNCLAGISRETVLELATKLSIPTRETTLLPYDLYTADEMFFTSTPYCMMPATRFNGIDVGAGEVGPITKRLLAAWSELVDVDIVQQAREQR